MGDLDPYMDDTFITSAFASMGEAVVTIKLIKNRTTGTPAGYCFVDFGDTQTAQNIMAKLNGMPIPRANPSKRFKLNWASYGKDTSSQGPEHSIFVGDLTPDVNDFMLQEYFQARYSSCKAAKVVLDQAGNSRGYGFVRFTDEGEHRRAMSEMQGAVGCGGKPLRVSAATPKRPQPSSGVSGGTGGAGGGSYHSTATTNQQYYQQYQQYQQYVAAWQGYQQQQQYYQQYQQPQQYQASYAQQTYQQQPVQYEEVLTVIDNTAEDPDPPLDIEGQNRALIETDNELFYELEQSRWNPVETATSAPRTVVT